MYHCIMTYLSKEIKQKLNVWKDQLIVNNMGSRNILLKVLVVESHIHMNTITACNYTQWSGLDEYMLTVGINIGR